MTYAPLGGAWLSGKYRKGQEVGGPGSAWRSRRIPGPLGAIHPSNAARLDVADALGAPAGQAGLTLVHMAVAFATRHPAGTSAIIVPRTTEHPDGYLAADGVDLSDDVLDRIDKIVPPGATINVARQRLGVQNECTGGHIPSSLRNSAGSGASRPRPRLMIVRAKSWVGHELGHGARQIPAGLDVAKSA